MGGQSRPPLQVQMCDNLTHIIYVLKNRFRYSLPQTAGICKPVTRKTGILFCVCGKMTEESSKREADAWRIGA